jgi:hypothetical protein
MKKKLTALTEPLTENDLLVDLTFHDVSATLPTENAETTVQPYYQGNLNQALKDPNRKSNNRTRASTESRQNKVETGKTKPRIVRGRRVQESSEAKA